ncbi:hypothetical protein DL768_010049 [Monosporascus sp. mg162]|nr:hypothetical protein DL768_010049 [Monosporascus sp. mg162]
MARIKTQQPRAAFTAKGVGGKYSTKGKGKGNSKGKGKAKAKAKKTPADTTGKIKKAKRWLPGSAAGFPGHGGKISGLHDSGPAPKDRSQVQDDVRETALAKARTQQDEQ